MEHKRKQATEAAVSRDTKAMPGCSISNKFQQLNNTTTLNGCNQGGVK